MAFRKIVKVLGRRQVRDCIEETPKEQLSASSAASQKLVNCKDAEPTSSLPVSKPLVIKKAEVSAITTPSSEPKISVSDSSLKSTKSAKSSSSLNGAAVCEVSQSQLRNSSQRASPKTAHINSSHHCKEYVNPSSQPETVKPSSAEEVSIKSDQGQAKTTQSSPSSLAKSRNSFSKISPSRFISKSSESIKSATKRTKDKISKKLTFKIGKNKSKNAKSASSSQVSSTPGSAWPSITKPDFIPVPLPVPLPKPSPTKKKSTKSKAIKPLIDPLAYLNIPAPKMGRKLFTPGPLMVTDRIKVAMQLDISTPHNEFAYITEFVRSSLLQIAKVDKDEFTAIPIGGTGTFAIEATLKTVFGTKNRKLVIMSNGTNGERVAKICADSKINHEVIPVDKNCLEETLRKNKDIAGVLVVHCEASSGLINPVAEIGEMVKNQSKDMMFIVDAMTTFGSVPLHMKNVDFAVSNSSRSLHSVPGIAFVIAKKQTLEKMRIPDIEKSMDIGSYLEDLDAKSHSNFTPPTQVMLAFKEALIEYSDEGSLEGRAEQYKKNHALMRKEMERMGFKSLFKASENPEGYLINVFQYPNNPLFVYEEFYQRLADVGCLLSAENKNLKKHFRIANMGNLSENDMRELALKIKQVLNDMRMHVPVDEQVF